MAVKTVNSFSTTLSAGIGTGATSVPVTDASGLPDISGASD